MNLEARIARLERQCRWYRNLFVLAALTAAAFLTYGAAQPIPDVIRAHGFKVIDKDGIGVADFHAWGRGGRLVIWNHAFKSVFEVAQNEKGGGQVTLNNSNGTEVVRITAADGDGMLTLNDKQGKQGLLLQAKDPARNGGLVQLNNRFGEPVVQLYAEDGGKGVLGAFGRKGLGRLIQP